MFEDQLTLSAKYVDLGYDAALPMPIIFENTTPVNVYSPGSNTSEFKFKYVPEEEFARIIKHVKRNKKKEHEEKEWLTFLTEKKKKCRCTLQPEVPESVMPSNISISAQNDGNDNAYIKSPGSVDVQGGYKKHDAVSKEAVSKAYRKMGGEVMLDISDAGKIDKHGRENNFLVAQKANKDHVHTSQTSSDTKFVKHSSSTFLETIQEEPPSSPGSEYSMLNDIECIYEERPFQMSKHYKADMTEPSQKHVFENNACYVPQPIVPKLNLCEVNKESIHSRRIRIIRRKMDSAFDGILKFYNRIPEPDGSQDLLRRRKRAAEFSSRFSRNYLYQLRRQVCELKQIREPLSLSRTRHTFHQLMCKKLVAAHQSALQGLQAYLHHMSSSVQGAANDKLKELLHYISELSRFCNKLGVATSDSAASGPGPDDVEMKSKALIKLISSKDSINEFEDNLLTSQDTEVSVMTTTGQKEWESSLRGPGQMKVPMISARGGCPVRKIISWRESVAKLARAAYGSPSRKRGLVALKGSRRFTSSKVTTKDEPTPPMKCGSALMMPCELALNIDMRHLSNKLLEVCEEEFRNKLVSLLRNLVDESEAEVTKKSGQSSASVEDMKALLQQIQSDTSLPLHQNKSVNSLHNTQRKDERKVTKVGPKNAQLICLLPDDTIPSLDPSDKESKAIRYKKSQDSTNSLGDCDSSDHKMCCEHESKSLMQTAIHHTGQGSCKSKPKKHVQIQNPVESKMNIYRPSMRTSQGHVEINQSEHGIQSTLPTALILPKKDIQSAMDYCQKFQSYMKSSPMYKGTSRPWVMVGRLSDCLVEQVLQEMVSETKLESVVQNIYTLELEGGKYF